MSPPFTQDQFLAVFAAYNSAIWPAQIVAFGLGAVAVAALGLRRPHGSRLILSILALMWAWNGIAYHFLFFSTINPAARLFGSLFVLQALLLAAAAFAPPDISIRGRRDIRSGLGLLVIFYAVLIYPLLGLRAGHGLMAGPMFGVSPCPATLFTLGLLLMFRGHWVAWLSVIPLLWAFIGFAAAFQLGMPEDFALPGAGLVFLSALVVDAIQARFAAGPARPAPGASVQ